jgi:hypothetical protein
MVRVGGGGQSNARGQASGSRTCHELSSTRRRCCSWLFIPVLPLPILVRRVAVGGIISSRSNNFRRDNCCKREGTHFRGAMPPSLQRKDTTTPCSCERVVSLDGARNGARRRARETCQRRTCARVKARGFLFLPLKKKIYIYIYIYIYVLFAAPSATPSCIELYFVLELYVLIHVLIFYSAF